MMNKDDHDRLVEIREEMMELLEEAKELVRFSGNKAVFERAKAYWIGHIDSALGDGEYIDTFDYTLKKTIDELEPSGDDEDEDAEDTEEDDEEDTEEEI